MAELYVALSPLSPKVRPRVTTWQGSPLPRIAAKGQSSSVLFYYGFHPQAYASRICSASSIADRWPDIEDKQTPAYDLVVSLKSKQRDTTNANPDF